MGGLEILNFRTVKITLFMPNLNGGGAERMMVTLANGFVRRGLEVSFLLCKQEGVYLKDLSEGVKVINLNSRTTFLSLFKLVSYCNNFRPDILLSSLTNANVVALIATMMSNSSTRLFLREASTVPPVSEGGFKDRILIYLMKIVYPLSKNIIAISNGVKEDLCKKINLKQCNVTVIYNPALTDLLLLKKNADADHPWLRIKTVPVIIAVGRLTPQKDFGTLIRAFSNLRKRKEVRLIIVGEGAEYAKLRELANNTCPGDIAFTGFVSNAFALMSKADVFVLSSRWEGFGNVLVEAMGCGVSVVSTDCPSGPSEILEKGKWGVLVPVGDVDAMSDAIERQLNTNPPKELISYVYDNFHETKIVDEYLELLLQNEILKIRQY